MIEQGLVQKANNPWKYKSQKKKTFSNKQKGKKKEKKQKETKEWEKQQLEPFKIEQQIKLSNRGDR